MIFRIEEFEVETKNYTLSTIGATKWMHGQPFDLPTLVSAPMRQEQSGTGFSCNICLETMTQMKRKGKKIVTTPCGHPFCKSCVEMAARSAYGRMPDPNHVVNNCPKCRKAYALRQLIELFIFHRELIIDGFGRKVQMVNKLLSLLLNIMINLQVFIALSWWTKWFGLGYRYRDIQRGFDIPKWLRFNKEFCPITFILVEVLWFDTMVTFAGVWGPIFIGNLVVSLIFSDVIVEPPQALGAPHVRPVTTMVQGFCFMLGFKCIHSLKKSFIQMLLASFCLLKIWVFKKIPVLGERLLHRQKCATNFLKRQAFNAHFETGFDEPKQKRRITVVRNVYENLGNSSMKKYILSRKTLIRRSMDASL
ncbi:Oidioi.mRNA.OKI2018_I69.PAR.g11983.t1.cds [Oikopleura dioica]|uniref:Oidioi.mRNA.OKI2018_I69.PAR.g11983.t1.cds n=1 Tax=Oikopleura dioica TaxID=34765 RepID=A0ABN7RYM5_OIKDI|nr:Oidioi.mRNA.OKI2018_I69.PAR.g11983.t1.cds [Oikopleura dioica]